MILIALGGGGLPIDPGVNRSSLYDRFLSSHWEAY